MAFHKIKVKVILLNATDSWNSTPKMTNVNFNENHIFLFSSNIFRKKWRKITLHSSPRNLSLQTIKQLRAINCDAERFWFLFSDKLLWQLNKYWRFLYFLTPRRRFCFALHAHRNISCWFLLFYWHLSQN